MRRGYAVIGSSWGDEGKGLVCDYLTARSRAGIVVRFNGGAQAAHTVVTPDGLRHVFHHFGSGTLAGAQTYLSADFICNPFLFSAELAILNGKTTSPPIVTVDPRSLITLPYDMLLNQAIEEQRGRERHGSCGVGIQETILRSQYDFARITVADLQSPLRLHMILNQVIEEYIPHRIRELGLEKNVLDGYLKSEMLTHNFYEAIHRFNHNTYIAGPDHLKPFQRIVFEGAQGLALDQNNLADMPYLTPSNTGLQNVAKLCQEADIEELYPYYVTRCYSTRHGAGPLPGEVGGLLYHGIVDETNRPGKYQGSVRYAPIDIDLLHERINRDLAQHGTAQCMKAPVLAVTCVDQVSGYFKYRRGGLTLSKDIWPEFIGGLIAEGSTWPVIWSNGPTRDHITYPGEFLYGAKTG